jgi:DNA repair protein RadD
MLGSDKNMTDLILRPYQDISISALRDGFQRGHRCQMFYLPTGGGKTECAISLLDLAAKKGTRAAMVMDRRVLVDQTSERLNKYKVDHGVAMAGHWRYLPHKTIQICSAQTLEARGSMPDLKLLIVDEAHCSRKSINEFIKHHESLKVIGLSASPFTKGLGAIYSNVISTTTTNERVENGDLCKLRVFVAKEIDMTGAAKVAGEWSDKETTARGIQITGDVVGEWVKKTHEIYGMAKKTIVFCAGIAHGLDLSAKFKEAGYRFESISYKDSEDDKAAIIKEFNKPDSEIVGLIATDVLTKGFDCPDVMIGISARPFSKSFSSHVQQLGRVMRQYQGKDFAVWIDHSGNFLRFLDQWEDLYHNGVSVLDDGAEKTKPEPTKEVKEAAKCPKCGELWGRGDVCQHCGERRVRRNTVIETAGTVVELGGKTKADKSGIDKDYFYAQLLGYAKQKGYKDGWAYHKVKEKFGTYPAHNVEPLPPTREVMAWVISRNIAYSKGKAR